MLEKTEKSRNKEQRYATKDYNLLKMQLALEYCFQKQIIIIYTNG